MMTRATAIGAMLVLLLLLLLAARAFLRPSTVPAGQRPLVRLSSANHADFKAAFDAGAGAPRLVLLLSPT
ncbi:MAG TPA: hypothetical protein VJA16_23420 [Thermoanaerobaculia bacterium]